MPRKLKFKEAPLSGPFRREIKINREIVTKSNFFECEVRSIIDAVKVNKKNSEVKS